VRPVVALAMAIALTACSSEPTLIDGSSADSFARTTEAARRDLPVADRLAFDAALRKAPGARYGMNQDEMETLARTTYNGMTAEEVIGMTR
jgi:hypothetical protein